MQRPNDPLAGLSAKHVFIEAIWLSEESANTKLFLLCLARFFDKDCHSASMSYAKIAQDCGFSEATSKRCASDARDRWLRIGVAKGFHVPGKGRQNLYRGIVPIDVLRTLREHKLAQLARQAGYPTDTPTPEAGYQGDTPKPISGYPTDTPVPERGITVTPRSPSGVSERPPKCNSYYTTESKETLNQTTESVVVVAPAKVATTLPDLKVLGERLLAAANGSLPNAAAYPGLLSMSVPMMWLEGGADLERDVLPTISVVGARAHQQRRTVKGWHYFTDAIVEAKRVREVGGAAFAAGTGPPNLEVAAEAWLKTPQGKMAIDIYGGRDRAKTFWIEQRQKVGGTPNA